MKCQKIDPRNMTRKRSDLQKRKNIKNMIKSLSKKSERSTEISGKKIENLKHPMTHLKSLRIKVLNPKDSIRGKKTRMKSQKETNSKMIKMRNSRRIKMKSIKMTNMKSPRMRNLNEKS